MNQYALSTDKETGEEKYILTKSRDGNPVKLENISMSSQTADELRHLVSFCIYNSELSFYVEIFKSNPCPLYG